MKRSIPTLLCLSLSLLGCVSVPLSTIVRMSAFGPQDFAGLNPDDIRARIKLLDGFSLDAAKSSLGVKITSGAGVHYGEFNLEEITEGRTELSKGVFAPDVTGTEYTLRLAAPSKEEFRKLQTFVKKGRPGEAVIFIAPILSSFPKDASTTTVWVDLQLEQHDGYFTLLDGAEVPMEGIRAANAGR